MALKYDRVEIEWDERRVKLYYRDREVEDFPEDAVENLIEEGLSNDESYYRVAEK